MIPIRTMLFAAFVATTVLSAGCGSKAPLLAPSPFVMLGEQGTAEYNDIPEHLRTPEIPILYWTDRADERKPGESNPTYGAGRSDATFFGVATVAPEDGTMTWAELAELSTTPGPHSHVKLRMSSVEQRGSLAPPLSRITVRDGNLFYPPESVSGYLSDVADFKQTMEPWLRPGNDNSAIVFVHGFNSSFDGAAFRLAKTWHAIGRDGVPILFTWPAGYDAFKPVAYNHDRESGEFAVHSLKNLLFSLAINERISRVHLVAHSRGTDVASTAVREIEAEIAASLGNTGFAQIARRKGPEELGDIDFSVEPSTITKIDTFTLVAADLDLDVFLQRFFANGSGRAAKRTSIYTSARDRAILISDIFFGSDERLGRATYEDFSPVIANSSVHSTRSRLSNAGSIRMTRTCTSSSTPRHCPT